VLPRESVLVLVLLGTILSVLKVEAGARIRVVRQVTILPVELPFVALTCRFGRVIGAGADLV